MEDTVKALLISSCFVAGTIGAFFPFVLHRFELHEALHVGESLASGVLIAAGLAHLLSESSKDFPYQNAPTPFIVCGGSFLLLQLLMNHVVAIGATCADSEGDAFQAGLWSKLRNCIAVLLFFAISTPAGAGLGWGLVHSSDPTTVSVIKAAAGGALLAVGVDGLQTQDHHDLSLATSGMQALVLFFGLAVHSFIAGMALGLQSDTSKLYQVFIAIISHKIVAAFSLGQSVVIAHRKAKPFELRPLLPKTVVNDSSESQAGVRITARRVWCRHIAAIFGFGVMSVLSFYT